MTSDPPPTGLNLRPATLDDAEAIADLENASNVAEVGFVWTTTEELRDRLTTPGRDPEDDLVLVADDGSLAGYLSLSTDEGSTDVHQLAWVHPSWWGRGLSDRLLRAGEEHARERVPDDAPGAVLRVSRWATNEAAARLFTALGYRFVRTFRTLRMELGDVASPEPPEGVVIHPFDRASDAVAVHAALAEAFADHWGSVAFSPFAEWVHEMIEGAASRFDPGLWFVASDGDEVVGAACVHVGTPREERLGVVDQLGVRRAWRGRGVGTGLLLTAFAELQRRGAPAVELIVDSDSPTGARRLYEAVGMRTAYAFEVWEKELRG